MFELFFFDSKYLLLYSNFCPLYPLSCYLFIWLLGVCVQLHMHTAVQLCTALMFVFDVQSVLQAALNEKSNLLHNKAGSSLCHIYTSFVRFVFSQTPSMKSMWTGNRHFQKYEGCCNGSVWNGTKNLIRAAFHIAPLQWQIIWKSAEDIVYYQGCRTCRH